jgi:hypothetical protein
MATPAESTKVLCVICNKAKGIYKCEGCSRIFCPKHSIDHRVELNRQLDEISVTHDLVHQTLNQQTEDLQQHPLIKKVNEWEQSAITKIRQIAEKARNELLKIASQHTTLEKEKLKTLSNELKEGREENDFSETDLKRWIQRLEEMKREVLSPTTTTIEEGSTSLINNIRIAHQAASDVFERVFGAAEIKENGCLVVKDTSGGHTEIRGKREYSTGIYDIRSQVEQFNGWIFFGIISKSQSMQANSFHSPSSYGWSNNNQIYLGTSGQCTSGPTIEIIQNDTIVLTIDCDQRKIALRNERLNRTIELPVDINKCQFPWQFHLNLHALNTRVRILNTSD